MVVASWRQLPYNGSIVYEVSISYITHATQPYVSQYEISDFDENGTLEYLWTAKVTQMLHDQDAVSSDVFKVDFPKGFP